MRFLFWGAGAIGTYVGGSLAAAGHDVSFAERPDLAEKLTARGLTVHREGMARTVRNVTFHPSASAALAAGPYDVAVFALKSFDTAAAASDLVATGLPVPPIMSLQNGIDNEATIASFVGEENVISGTVMSAVGKPGMGEAVEEKRRGMGVALGHPAVPGIVEALQDAGLNARAFPAAGPMKWSKLLTNLTGNATSAILDLPVADIYADTRLYRLEVKVLRECLAVMDALGFRPVDLPGAPVRALAFAARRLPRFIAQPALTRALGSGRGDKMPSFHIDLHSGKGRSEVGWLNGAVVRHGETVGVPTPVNRVLTETLQALTDGEDDIEKYRRNPDALLSLIR